MSGSQPQINHDKSINLLMILICPWHQPPKPPLRSSLIELTTEYSARLLEGDPLERPQRAKELGTKEICCWFVSNMGTTIKNPQTTGSLHQNGNILNHHHTSCDFDGFGNPHICWSIELSFCWIRSSAKASGFASGMSTLRCELGLETDAFLLRLPFEFCRLWQMKRVEQAFLHQKLTLVDKDLTKWTCEL